MTTGLKLFGPRVKKDKIRQAPQPIQVEGEFLLY